MTVQEKSSHKRLSFPPDMAGYLPDSPRTLKKEHEGHQRLDLQLHHCVTLKIHLMPATPSRLVGMGRF